jgi:glycosyltransferase involved in cell wall biosynthesis
MTVGAWVALLTMLVWLAVALDMARGNRMVRMLATVPDGPLPRPPRVSVVVAARNEERHLRAALTSLLRIAYPSYELIVVDDRSEDGTGSLLAELAADYPRLQVITVTDLPAGWLGKNHALWCGTRAASGDLLLFTDADIVMDPSVLTRAVRLVEEEGLDHLAVSPAMTMPTTFLQMFGASFIIFFGMFVRPWKVRDPASSCHVGIGAFNLVRAAAYRTVGGHETIRLRPDDDLKLGKIIKRGGFRSDVAFGPGLLAVAWYGSVGEVVRGLEKNAFAGCDYRVWLSLSGIIFYLVGTVWPYLALVVTDGWTRLFSGVTVLTVTLLCADSAGFNGMRRWYAAGFPLCALLFAWIMLRTMVLNLAQGGISWRGTFYPLAELRKNRV